ncbi:hypothetical protein EB72_24850 [Mycobacterium sp. SWH-M1]|nr:hypothetical protein EB72_24850 [Mycobacterium sp. SWH-M1]
MTQPNPTGLDTFIAEAVRQLEADDAPQEAIDAATFAMQKAQMLFSGESIGTVRIDPATGSIATRIAHPETGIPLWRVTNPADGSQHDDHRTSLPTWTWIAGPTEEGS